MKKVGENKGITMIVLVVTIAIMLILAGVTISTVFGDEGLIKQSKELAKQTESSIEGDNNDVNSLINELNSLMQTQAGVGQKGITVWSNGKATIELEAINVNDDNYEIQWQKNGTSGSWTVGTTVTDLLSGDKVYAKLVSDRYGELETVINILDTNPIPNSIEINGLIKTYCEEYEGACNYTFNKVNSVPKEIELNWENGYGKLAKGTCRIIK